MDTGGKRESNFISKIMIEQLIEYDKELLQFLNGYHTPWLDPVMLILTETITWLPLYLFLLYLVIKEYKKESWMILLGIAPYNSTGRPDHSEHHETVFCTIEAFPRTDPGRISTFGPGLYRRAIWICFQSCC